MTGDPLNIMAGIFSERPLKKSWTGDSPLPFRSVESIHVELAQNLDLIDLELGDQTVSSSDEIQAARDAISWSP